MLAQPAGGFEQILSAVTKAQTFSIEFFEQLYGVPWRHPYVWQGESCEFREALGSITKDKFITHTLALMSDLSKIFPDMTCNAPVGAVLVWSTLS